MLDSNHANPLILKIRVQTTGEVSARIVFKQGFTDSCDTEILFLHTILANNGELIKMLNKISAADAGKNLSDIIKRVAFDHEPVILTMSGEPTAAIVSLEDFQYFQYLEDQADIAEALKAAEEPGENITAGQMRKQLGLTK